MGKKKKSTKQQKNTLSIRRMDIMKLSNILNRISQDINGKDYPIKFIYKLAKIKKVIDDEVETYREMQQEIYSIITEYEQKRVELLNKYGEKDENGNLKTDTMGNVVIPEDKRSEFDNEMKKLMEEYKEDIDKFNKKLEEHNEFLNEEIDFELPKLKLKDLPDNLPLNLNEMEVFMLIVKDD